MGYPWDFVYEWQPFNIDALGLVTILGAQEIDNAVGRLVPSGWLEYMPLLAGYVIASDQIRQKKPAFNWYNISSGIHTTDLSCWFSRWLMAQDFTPTRSIVWWEVKHPRRRTSYHQYIAAALAICAMGSLIVLAILSGDWYGLANGLSITISILVRSYILHANRTAIDAAVLNAEREGDKGAPGGKAQHANHVKTLLILPNSNVVTVVVPENLIRTVFVRNPAAASAWKYDLARAVGWVAFGAHVVCLGMARLLSQVCTTVLLIMSTVLVCYRVGCDDFQGLWKRTNSTLPAPPSPSAQYTCWIGSHMQATVLDWPAEVDFARDENGSWRRRRPQETTPRSDRRQDLYAWLNLSAEEESSLVKWDLIPHDRGSGAWMADFQAKRDLVSRQPVDVPSLLGLSGQERTLSGGPIGRQTGDEEGFEPVGCVQVGAPIGSNAPSTLGGATPGESSGPPSTCSK